MRILSLNATINSPGHGNDAGGAFIPQSIRFSRARKAAGDVVESAGFDNSLVDQSKRRAAFLGLVDAAQPFQALAYFGHGLRTGLPSAGVSMAHVDAMASALARKASGSLAVVLYACSTAGAPGADRDRLDGDGGFADALRDRLGSLGLTGHVDAHTIAGHTTVNRYTRRFVMGETTGGKFIVEPNSPLWAKWGERLKEDEAFRFGFPFMDVAEIRTALAG